MFFGTKTAHKAFAPALVFVSVGMSSLLGACGGNSDGQGACSANACITNENNYKASPTLDIKRVAAKAQADLKISWDQLKTNLMKRDIDPEEVIDSVTFLQIPDLTEAEITAQLAKGTFNAEDVPVYRSYKVEQQSGSSKAVAMNATLSQFKLGSVYLDPSVDFKANPDFKYMLLFANKTTPGYGTQSMLFLDPSGDAEEVSALPGGDILTFNADLSTPARVSIPKDGPYLVDWSQLKKDGRGNDIIYDDIDSLMVAFYAKSVSELEADALNYDIHADILYKVDIVDGVKKMDLANARTEGGEAFSGFDGSDGIWAVGLLCDECQIPTPLAVALLDPT